MSGATKHAAEQEDLLKPLKLSRETRKLLEAMGKPSTGPTVLYGLEQTMCEQALRKVVDPLLSSAGLNSARVDQYHWFLRELAKLLRTKYGHDLAFCVELTMRKWMNFGLSPQVMGFLVCRIHDELQLLAGRSEADCTLPDRGCPRSDGKGENAEDEEKHDDTS